MDSHTLTDIEIRRHLAEIDARQFEINAQLVEMYRDGWKLRWQAVTAVGVVIAALVALGVAIAPAFYAALHTGHL